MVQRTYLKAIRLSGLFCLLLWCMPAKAKEITLEEVGLSLYNKPVTGFRIVFERSERYVAQQVTAHVALADDARPFQYERSIIYENIRYAPIAADRDISLYYLLKGIQGQYTELTLVAMYDYRRSISTREFPELTQRLKADLAKLVTAISGDQLRDGDHIIDPAQAAKQPDKGPQDGPIAEHAKQEEVDNPKVLLHKDPFAEPKTSNDTALQRLQHRVEALEAQEQSLRDEIASLQRKDQVVQAKLKSYKALQDSVNMLNDRIEAMIGQAYVADDVSISNETAMRLQELDKENQRLKKQIAQLENETDSLSKSNQGLQAQLASLGSSGKTAAERLATLNDENKQLRRELEDYKARVALGGGGNSPAADSILRLLSKSEGKVADLNLELEGQQRKLGRLKQEHEEVSNRSMQLEERIASLEAENMALRNGNAEIRSQLPDEHLMDSLNGEIRSARRNASIAKAEATQVRADMAELQKAKDAQAARLQQAEREAQDLQVRIEALQAQASGEGGNPSKAGNAALSDSLVLLRQRLYHSEERASTAEHEVARLKDIETTLQAKERALTTAETGLKKKEIELGDALRAKAATQRSLDDANAQLNEARNARTGSQQELDRLTQEQKNLQAKLNAAKDEAGRLQGENKSLADTASALRRQRSALQADITARDRSIRQQIQARDSIQQQLATAQSRENDLRRNIDALEHKVDSLARLRVPEGEQARFLKEQRAKLEQWQKELETNSLAIADKEKLLNQRETTVSKRETELSGQMDRFKNLEERERSISLREQQVANKESETINTNTPIQVKEGRLMEFGTQVPVFVVEAQQAPKLVVRQVVGYMLSRDALLDSHFPEIRYRSVSLPEIDTEPVELKVRIDSKQDGSTVQISFRLSNGEYLGPDKYRDRTDAAKQLIGRMLRYKI